MNSEQTIVNIDTSNLKPLSIEQNNVTIDTTKMNVSSNVKLSPKLSPKTNLPSIDQQQQLQRMQLENEKIKKERDLMEIQQRDMEQKERERIAYEEQKHRIDEINRQLQQQQHQLELDIENEKRKREEETKRNEILIKQMLAREAEEAAALEQKRKNVKSSIVAPSQSGNTFTNINALDDNVEMRKMLYSGLQETANPSKTKTNPNVSLPITPQISSNNNPFIANRPLPSTSPSGLSSEIIPSFMVTSPTQKPILPNLTTSPKIQPFLPAFQQPRPSFTNNQQPPSSVVQNNYNSYDNISSGSGSSNKLNTSTSIATNNSSWNSAPLIFPNNNSTATAVTNGIQQPQLNDFSLPPLPSIISSDLLPSITSSDALPPIIPLAALSTTIPAISTLPSSSTESIPQSQIVSPPIIIPRSEADIFKEKADHMEEMASYKLMGIEPPIEPSYNDSVEVLRAKREYCDDVFDNKTGVSLVGIAYVKFIESLEFANKKLDPGKLVIGESFLLDGVGRRVEEKIHKFDKPFQTIYKKYLKPHVGGEVSPFVQIGATTLKIFKKYHDENKNILLEKQLEEEKRKNKMMKRKMSKQRRREDYSDSDYTSEENVNSDDDNENKNEPSSLKTRNVSGNNTATKPTTTFNTPNNASVNNSRQIVTRPGPSMVPQQPVNIISNPMNLFGLGMSSNVQFDPTNGNGSPKQTIPRPPTKPLNMTATKTTTTATTTLPNVSNTTSITNSVASQKPTLSKQQGQTPTPTISNQNSKVIISSPKQQSNSQPHIQLSPSLQTTITTTATSPKMSNIGASNNNNIVVSIPKSPAI
jgi:hypothetical protein